LATIVSNPYPIFGSQEPREDGSFDTNEIDNFLIETDTPPTAVIEPVPMPALPEPKHITRVISGTYRLNALVNIAPFPVLPADTERLDLRIRAYSYATTPGSKDYAFLADENGKLVTQSAITMRHGVVIDLTDHTGALWVMPGPILTDDFEITWWAVTK
jgi:hypothetical protein